MCISMCVCVCESSILKLHKTFNFTPVNKNYTSLLFCTLMQTTWYASFASQESKLTILKMADMLGEGVRDFFPPF